MSFEHISPTNPPVEASGPKPSAPPTARPSSESSGRLPAVKLTKDTADISASGHAALDAEVARSSVPALTDGQAQQLGTRLAASNPNKFKHADANGDGRLSAREAKEAGLE